MKGAQKASFLFWLKPTDLHLNPTLKVAQRPLQGLRGQGSEPTAGAILKISYFCMGFLIYASGRARQLLFVRVGIKRRNIKFLAENFMSRCPDKTF